MVRPTERPTRHGTTVSAVSVSSSTASSNPLTVNPLRPASFAAPFVAPLTLVGAVRPLDVLPPMTGVAVLLLAVNRLAQRDVVLVPQVIGRLFQRGVLARVAGPEPAAHLAAPSERRDVRHNRNRPLLTDHDVLVVVLRVHLVLTDFGPSVMRHSPLLAPIRACEH